MAAAAFGLMAVGVAAPALATVKYPEGGTWTYGNAAGTNFSYYEHPSKTHGSSVSNPSGTVRSACEQGGWMSRAEQNATDSGNKAFYRFC
jgi:lactococcin 972 family bacteriocin